MFDIANAAKIARSAAGSMATGSQMQVHLAELKRELIDFTLAVTLRERAQ